MMFRFFQNKNIEFSLDDLRRLLVEQGGIKDLYTPSPKSGGYTDELFSDSLEIFIENKIILIMRYIRAQNESKLSEKDKERLFLLESQVTWPDPPSERTSEIWSILDSNIKNLGYYAKKYGEEYVKSIKK